MENRNLIFNFVIFHKFIKNVLLYYKMILFMEYHYELYTLEPWSNSQALITEELRSLNHFKDGIFNT